MSATIRIAATVRADFLIRFRRLSTAVIFLLLSAVAYAWVPDPATGRALLVIDGQRALLNSAAIGMASASLAAIFIGLCGFYVISNALRTDIETRCGFVIAATPVRRFEYIVGKFLGNLTFLFTFTIGFMLVSMVMVWVRGEATLEPLVFAGQYLLLVPPSLAFVSALAILFEAVPMLSGRFGDVLYFFVWTASLSVVPILLQKGGSNLSLMALFDFSGLGYLIALTQQALHTDAISIGASDFVAAKGTFLFEGLPVSFGAVALRLLAMLVPAILILPAAALFHRFDPSRVKVRGPKGSTGLLARLNTLTKPLARLVHALPTPFPNTLAGAVGEEVRLTLAAFPLLVLAALVVAGAGLVMPLPTFLGGVLPAAFVVTAIGIAEIGCREGLNGTTALLYATPHLRERYVFWKFGAALGVALTVFALPLLRVALSQPGTVPALLVGIVFVAALATLLAVVSGTPKTFLIVFLLLWYISGNTHGQIPQLDYAGLQGAATPLTVLGYLAASVAALAAAHIWHRRQLA